MSKINLLNLKVAILDTDFFALQAINSYLAWDRRTRVIHFSENPDYFWSYLQELPPVEYPDVIVVDSAHLPTPTDIRAFYQRIAKMMPRCQIIALVQHISDEKTEAIASENNVRGLFLKQDVRIRLAWAIVYAQNYDFVITRSIAQACRTSTNKRLFTATILPGARLYPEMTDRIRQAIQLCVVEGMPAHLAADEMGISLHTIRGYIKDGYRILENYDEREYPMDMTPQERAFLRFTALADD